ncbi:hypothetical protein [Limnospira fusiformis]|uniref:hypothetical protein n=1 Tax=Limnospira fusiformis TaxID=54297 RepID=UPI002AA0FAD4|nr:hypothetical protein [Limnospira fusiformis LS22]
MKINTCDDILPVDSRIRGNDRFKGVANVVTQPLLSFIADRPSHRFQERRSHRFYGKFTIVLSRIIC